MRALLVVNPNATATTPRVRGVLASALACDLRVDLAQTKGRGHATELGERAVDDGYDLVVALGGDGTVNEVANGLLRDGPAPSLPALAVVPGGSTNVFARALGLPGSAVEATGALLEALREGRSRRIGLGRAGERWFTFCGGLGLDAATVRLVERKRAKGRSNSAGLYVRCAVSRFYLGTDRRHPALTLTAPGLVRPEWLFAGLICNTSPWTYLGEHPVTPCPRASFDTGLDVLGMRRLRTFGSLRTVGQLLRPEVEPHGRTVVVLHDLAELTLSAEGEPLPLQVDGEYLGDEEGVTFRSVPSALRVIA
ncbi:MAG TPA: diacylglycerol kinase family protein [Frankiaceae bacterium]|nr:diacylglycerol kinase family protein [Frankiaceae bacterium]